MMLNAVHVCRLPFNIPSNDRKEYQAGEIRGVLDQE